MKIIGKACISLLVLLLIITPSAVFSAVPNMQEGKWENTIEMKMEMPVMPFAMPPMTFTTIQCLTKKDIVPDTAQKDQKCEIKDQKIIGDKVTWRVQCVDENGTLDGRGEITYSGNSYAGFIQMKSIPKEKGAQPMNMSYKLKGLRIGDCPK